MPQPFAIVLLAAGGSARLGQPKQFVRYQQKTLLDISLDAALQSGADRVLLVSGAVEPPALVDPRLQLVHNPEWKTGMAASIGAGIAALPPGLADLISGIIIMACDQPFITAALLNNLVTLQQQTGKKIVASAYAGTAGIPAFFHRDLSPDLLALKGDRGAKKLLFTRAADLATVDFPPGAVDIDTPEDYEQLKRGE